MTITELVNWSDKTSSLAKLENGYHFGGTELDDFEKSWYRPSPDFADSTTSHLYPVPE